MVCVCRSWRMLAAASVAFGCVVSVSLPALAQGAKTESNAKVKLGEDKLMTGIPGKGPLTVAEVTA